MLSWRRIKQDRFIYSWNPLLYYFQVSRLRSKEINCKLSLFIFPFPDLDIWKLRIHENPSSIIIFGQLDILSTKANGYGVSSWSRRLWVSIFQFPSGSVSIWWMGRCSVYFLGFWNFLEAKKWMWSWKSARSISVHSWDVGISYNNYFPSFTRKKIIFINYLH